MANGPLEFDPRDRLGTQQLDFQKGKARFHQIIYRITKTSNL